MSDKHEVRIEERPDGYLVIHTGDAPMEMHQIDASPPALFLANGVDTPHEDHAEAERIRRLNAQVEDQIAWLLSESP